MSKKKNQEFKNKYKVHPVRQDAIAKFKEANQVSLSSETRKYIYQFLANIGLEIEDRFPQIQFEDGKSALFGREKSKKSISDKKKINIRDFDTEFRQAIIDGNEDAQIEIRPIYDYYGFKFVCSKVSDIDKIKKRVMQDFKSLDNIPPELQDKFDKIDEYRKQSISTKDFIDEVSSIDMSNISYRKYYDLITQCYAQLDTLSYDSCTDEKDYFAQKIQEMENKIQELEATSTASYIIPSPSYKEYEKDLKMLLKRVEARRTDKLDLAVGDLVIFDIIHTSEHIKDLGVSCSKEASRTKEKRLPNGYVSNFYSFDMPNGMTSELQIQSGYRYEYGEHGPAAHNKMQNNVKKRKFLKRPTATGKYKKWEKRMFKSLPRYFTYKGSGIIHIYNAFDNFRRYYDCEDPKKVKDYVQFIASHNIDLLETRFKRFKLGEPSVLSEKNEADKGER